MFSVENGPLFLHQRHPAMRDDLFFVGVQVYDILLHFRNSKSVTVVLQYFEHLICVHKFVGHFNLTDFILVWRLFPHIEMVCLREIVISFQRGVCSRMPLAFFAILDNLLDLPEFL